MDQSLARAPGNGRAHGAPVAMTGGAADRQAIGSGWSGLAASHDSSGDGAGLVPSPLPDAASARAAPAARAHARRLIAAANELLDLAAELEKEDLTGPADSAPPHADAAAEDEGRWLRHARQAYRHRRNRSQFFDEALFGEPAWDILLDLFIAAKERKRVPVTSACIGAAVPTTTALRWLTILEDRQLILREADPTDARRIFVRLTTDAYAKMVAYFARAAAGDGDEGGEAGRSLG